MKKNKNRFKKNKNNKNKEISPLGKAMIDSVSNLKDVEFSSSLDRLNGRRPFNKDDGEYNYTNSPID